MTVYIDLIFLENTFMNLIILYATSIILKRKIKIIRLLAGSLIGALYACLYYISNLEIYSSVLLKMMLSIVIVYISFNSNTIKNFLRELLIFYLTSFTFGGVTFALLYFIYSNNIVFENGVLVGIYPLKMILIGGIMGFGIIVISFKTIKNKIVKKDMVCKLKIIFNKKNANVDAFIDTGNFLKEPLTGMPVVIVERNVLQDIIPTYILNNLENIISGNIQIDERYITKIKLIPFTALGTENGLLLGIKPDELIIDYQDRLIKNNNLIIGIYNKRLSKTNKYNALIGLDLIEKI